VSFFPKDFEPNCIVSHETSRSGHEKHFQGRERLFTALRSLVDTQITGRQNVDIQVVDTKM
jgi:hypothetical protein